MHSRSGERYHSRSRVLGDEKRGEESRHRSRFFTCATCLLLDAVNRGRSRAHRFLYKLKLKKTKIDKMYKIEALSRASARNMVTLW